MEHYKLINSNIWTPTLVSLIRGAIIYDSIDNFLHHNSWFLMNAVDAAKSQTPSFSSLSGTAGIEYPVDFHQGLEHKKGC